MCRNIPKNWLRYKNNTKRLSHRKQSEGLITQSFKKNFLYRNQLQELGQYSKVKGCSELTKEQQKMQKPQTLDGTGFAKNSIRRTLSQTQPKNQALARLQREIDQRTLTNCLDALADVGYSGDTAIFIIASVQQVTGGML